MHDLYCIALARTYIFIIVMYSSFTFLLTLLLLPPITPPPHNTTESPPVVPATESSCQDVEARTRAGGSLCSGTHQLH